MTAERLAQIKASVGECDDPTCEVCVETKELIATVEEQAATIDALQAKVETDGTNENPATGGIVGGAEPIPIT